MKNFSFNDVSACYYQPAQQRTLENITIGIAGAGGIGSNCAVLLVRSGFSRFVIADFDRVIASNLNRQAYAPHHIDRLKVECLDEICRAINPSVALTPVPLRIDQANARTIFDRCDVLIEAFDDAAAKAMLFGEFIQSGKLLVGVSGIGGIGESDRIIIRKVREKCFIVGDARSAVSETLKPHAPRVTVAAAKMADIVLSEVLGPHCPVETT